MRLFSVLKEDTDMMNRIVKKDFTQEIAAVIRAAKSENNLRSLLKGYHPRDVARPSLC